MHCRRCLERKRKSTWSRQKQKEFYVRKISTKKLEEISTKPSSFQKVHAAGSTNSSPVVPEIDIEVLQKAYLEETASVDSDDAVD